MEYTLFHPCYFVNKPLPWCVVLSYTGPRLRNCPRSINSIPHTTEVVYSFYESTIIFLQKQTKQRRRRSDQAHVICHGLYYVTKLNMTYDWSLHPNEIGDVLLFSGGRGEGGYQISKQGSQKILTLPLNTNKKFVTLPQA